MLSSCGKSSRANAREIASLISIFIGQPEGGHYILPICGEVCGPFFCQLVRHPRTSQAVKGKMSLKNKETGMTHYYSNPMGDPEADVCNHQATSIYELFEWMVKQIQASFSRLGDLLLFEEIGDSHLILKLLVPLYNF